jgi:hypothetical protein
MSNKPNADIELQLPALRETGDLSSLQSQLLSTMRLRLHNKNGTIEISSFDDGSSSTSSSASPGHPQKAVGGGAQSTRSPCSWTKKVLRLSSSSPLSAPQTSMLKIDDVDAKTMTDREKAAIKHMQECLVICRKVEAGLGTGDDLRMIENDGSPWTHAVTSTAAIGLAREHAYLAHI